MTLRCKPGDLAVVVDAGGYPQYLGLFVEILEPAPLGTRFMLPDGYPAISRFPNSWICKTSIKVVARLPSGATRTARYVVITDWRLRPIRPGADPVDESRDEPVEAAA